MVVQPGWTIEPYDLATFAKLSLRKFSLVGPLTEVFVAEEILHCTAADFLCPKMAQNKVLSAALKNSIYMYQEPDRAVRIKKK